MQSSTQILENSSVNIIHGCVSPPPPPGGGNDFWGSGEGEKNEKVSFFVLFHTYSVLTQRFV